MTKSAQFKCSKCNNPCILTIESSRTLAGEPMFCVLDAGDANWKRVVE